MLQWTHTYTAHAFFFNVQKLLSTSFVLGATWRLNILSIRKSKNALIIIRRIWEVKSRETNKRYLSFLLCRCRHHQRHHNNDHSWVFLALSKNVSKQHSGTHSPMYRLDHRNIFDVVWTEGNYMKKRGMWI